MRIVLNQTESGTELHLDVYKVDTPTGVGWSVLTPQGRNVLIKLIDGNWQAEDDQSISQEFWQMVGEEIGTVLATEHIASPTSSCNLHPKRARILKYLLV
jgi:hypothetical protein